MTEVREFHYRAASAFTHTASDTTEADVTGFGFWIGAGETWEYEIWIRNGCSTANGIMWNITVPASAELLSLYHGSLNSATAFRHDETTSSGTDIFTYNGQNSQNHQTRIVGTVKAATTAGMVQLGVKNNVSGVSQTATVNTGSWMRAVRVG